MVGQINIVGSENKILGIANELHTYCSLRCKIPSPTLYNIYKSIILKEMEQNKEKGMDQRKKDHLTQLERKLSILSPTIL